MTGPGRGTGDRTSDGGGQENAPGVHARWLRLHRDQLGVDVVDPDGHEIGSATAPREVGDSVPARVAVAVGAATGLPAPAAELARRVRIGGWTPVDGRKHVLVGEFDRYDFYDTWKSGDEADFNIMIAPDPPFAFLLQEVVDTMEREAAYYRTIVAAAARVLPVLPGEPLADYPRSQLHERVRPGGGYVVECEITPDEHYYDNPWFGRRPAVSPLVGRTLGVYGPWVRDFSHAGRPEIHPCEVIWWRNGTPVATPQVPLPFVRWTVLVLQDDSNRFDRPGDYTGPVPRPWSASPRRAHLTFALAAIRGRTNDYRLDLERRRNVAEQPGADDAELVRRHDSGTVVRVRKRMTPPSLLGARLGHLVPDPADPASLRCLLEVDVELGAGDRGKEGFAELSLEYLAPREPAPERRDHRTRRETRDHRTGGP